ncbi:nuclear transport factor 2 family protein [Streptomyces sp. NPDC046821]|uniref:nuclear transport factor 2 family protein n=1 Tax=Streptomyces sp. NPDC046821 TaxID=3154702 RepID=UPI0033FA030A
MTPVPVPGHQAIMNLVGIYAERLDAGDFAGAAELFAHATITSEGYDRNTSGADAVREMFETWTRRYEDNGTPHTKHVTTNLVIDVDDQAGTGTCRSYVTVFQATDRLPLQPVFAGRYHDRFERADGTWRFSHRHMITDYVGDLSHHLLQPIG